MSRRVCTTSAQNTQNRKLRWRERGQGDGKVVVQSVNSKETIVRKKKQPSPCPRLDGMGCRCSGGCSRGKHETTVDGRVFCRWVLTKV